MMGLRTSPLLSLCLAGSASELAIWEGCDVGRDYNTSSKGADNSSLGRPSSGEPAEVPTAHSADHRALTGPSQKIFSLIR